MKIEIYQINSYRDENRVKFIKLSSLSKYQEGSDIKSFIYDKVFEGSVDCSSLEDVYVLFNTTCPAGHVGHSLSVSDVVKVCESTQHQEYGFYYCDSVGFKKVDFEPAKAFSKINSHRTSLNEVINIANTVKENQRSCKNSDKLNKVVNNQIDL